MSPLSLEKLLTSEGKCTVWTQEKKKEHCYITEKPGALLASMCCFVLALQSQIREDKYWKEFF